MTVELGRCRGPGIYLSPTLWCTLLTCVMHPPTGTRKQLKTMFQEGEVVRFAPFYKRGHSYVADRARFRSGHEMCDEAFPPGPPAA